MAGGLILVEGSSIRFDATCRSNRSLELMDWPLRFRERNPSMSLRYDVIHSLSSGTRRLSLPRRPSALRECFLYVRPVGLV